MEVIYDQIRALEGANEKLISEKATHVANEARLNDELKARDLDATAKANALRELNRDLSLSKGEHAALEKACAGLREEMASKAKAAADHVEEIARLKEELAAAKREYVDDVKELGNAVKSLKESLQQRPAQMDEAMRAAS